MRTAKAIGIVLVAAGLASAQVVTSSDGDGVPDIWKTNGFVAVTLNGQTARIDLAGQGVRKGTKAVIVWVDWMAAPTIRTGLLRLPTSNRRRREQSARRTQLRINRYSGWYGLLRAPAWTAGRASLWC